MTGVLDGIRVLDLSWGISGPMTTMLMTDHGAEDLRCGGAPMAGPNEEAPASAIAEGFTGGALIGKRYIDEADRIELLCIKGGKGSLSLGTEALQVKVPKALPSSD